MALYNAGGITALINSSHAGPSLEKQSFSPWLGLALGGVLAGSDLYSGAKNVWNGNLWEGAKDIGMAGLSAATLGVGSLGLQAARRGLPALARWAPRLAPTIAKATPHVMRGLRALRGFERNVLHPIGGRINPAINKIPGIKHVAPFFGFGGRGGFSKSMAGGSALGMGLMLGGSMLGGGQEQGGGYSMTDGGYGVRPPEPYQNVAPQFQQSPIASYQFGAQ